MAVFNNALAGAAGQISAFTLEKSVRLNDDDTAYLSKTFSSNGNRKTYTMSLWVKRGNLGKSYQSLFSNPDSNGYNGVYFDFSNDYLHIGEITSGWAWLWQSAAQYRDTSAWYHIVAAIDTTQAVAANRIKVYVNGVQVTDFYPGYPTYPAQNLDTNFNNNTLHAIGQLGSVAASAYNYDGYMADFYFIDGQALDATSFGAFDSNGVWQAATFTGAFGTNGFHVFDFANEGGIGDDSSGNNNDFTGINNISDLTLSGNYAAYVFSGPGTTYNGSATGTSFIYGTPPADGFDGDTTDYALGYNDNGTWIYFRPAGGISGVTKLRIFADYVEDIYVNGSSATRTSGTGNQWYEISNPPSTLNEIAVKGITSSSAVGRFSAIEINNTVLVEGTSVSNDVLRDVPTNGDSSSDTGAGGEVSGNYCTLNLLDTSIYSGSVAIANGNLEYNGTNSSAGVKGTIFVSSGKWYWECTLSSGSSDAHVGIGDAAAIYYPGYSSNSYAYDQTGKKRTSDTASNYGAAYTSGDIIGVALDLDNGTLAFYKNGSSQGTAFTGLIGTFAPQVGNSVTNTSSSWTLNCGQRVFNTTAPAGFKALCTTNLPAPTIANGLDHFDTVLYAGTDSSQSITGLNFSPDLVWTKNRTSAASHAIYDIVRGAGLGLRPDQTDVEYTASARFASFDSNGFSIGGSSGENNALNKSYVSWAWNAGSSTASNTNGSLNSSAYDQSQTWSTAGTITNSSTISSAFDGNLSSFWAANANTVSRYTFPSVYSGTKFELRLDVSLANTNFSVNGQTSSSVTGAIPAITWVDVTDAVLASNLGGLSYIEIGYVPAQYSTSIYAVRIDGKMLVDSGITPTNVPSIGSTVRASQTAGISIVSYTGSGSAGTVGHGLNAEPDMIILKDRNSAQNWKVLHSAAVTSSYSKHYQNLTWLNSNSPTTSTGTGNGYPWNNSPPTPFVFSASNSGSNYSASQSSVNYIAYCFSGVKDFSQFGSFVGDGVANSGPFVFTSFRPAFLMIKGVDGGDHWYIYDSKRDGYNPDNEQLTADITDAEYAAANYPSIDFLSNGFKVRSGNNAGRNQSGITYMYMCFAEKPFQANGGLAR